MGGLVLGRRRMGWKIWHGERKLGSGLVRGWEGGNSIVMLRSRGRRRRKQEKTKWNYYPTSSRSLHSFLLRFYGPSSCRLFLVYCVPRHPILPTPIPHNSIRPKLNPKPIHQKKNTSVPTRTRHGSLERVCPCLLKVMSGMGVGQKGRLI